ncbi:MAG: oligosaccharide flippase family protein [Lachnospiraceae bacterium]|nr:oligosaccharide flippase family protein [Lachnospiraceae bacterium]
MKFRKLFQSDILKGTLYTLSGKIVAMLLYMALDIACARILSPDDYAEWVFFYAVLTMMFYIGWCGINTSAKVFVSKESTREGVSRTIQASFMLRLIASILVSVILLSIAFPLAKWLGYPDKYPSLYRLCIFAGLLVFLNSYTEFFKGLFMGLGDFKKLCGITILEFSGYFWCSLAFLIPLKRVEAITLGYACSGIIVFLSGSACLKRIIGASLLPQKTDKHLAIMKTIFKYAVPIAISSIGGMILVEMDTFMLGILSTKTQVANYGIAKNLCAKATHVNVALTVGSMTSFSVLTVENIKEKCSKLMKTSCLNILISAVVAGAFILLGTFMITVLYGVKYSEAGTILKYLVPYYVMYAISTFFATFLDFQGKAKVKSICYCTVVILNLILNLMLIPKLGATGAAIATSLSLVPYTILVLFITVSVIRRYARQ